MSEKLRRAREAWENEHPDWAAKNAARRFELAAIAVPVSLSEPIGAPTWILRAHRDAVSLYRELVMAEPVGLTLTELRAAVTLGSKRVNEALKLLRGTDAVAESRRDGEGFDVDRIVLRARS